MDLPIQPLRETIRYIRENLKGNLIGAEIGVNNGKHAKKILEALNCRLYLIDIWEDYPENFRLDQKPVISKKCATKELVKKILDGYDVRIIKGESVEVAKTFPDKFFDFVYIDANHTYEYVKKDIIAWRPRVRKGGVLGGHDYCQECEGVMKAVDELVPNAISKDRYVTLYGTQIPLRYYDWYTVI